MDFENSNPTELVNYVVSHFHDGHRKALPELMQVAEKVEQVHQGHPSCPQGLSNLLFRIWNELQLHMEKEERVLFPMIQSGNYQFAQFPIQAMMNEHQHHSEELEKIQLFKAEHPLPADACRTWRLLFDLLNQFESELKEHIQFENEILFRRVLNQKTSEIKY